MSAELERACLKSRANSAGSGGRALSVNVQRLHDALHVLLDDAEREQFAHCLSVYHAKRNVYDLVQTLRVILDTPGKRHLLPLLRLVLPRADQMLFDQYTSEGPYLKSEPLASAVDAHQSANAGPVTTETHARVHFSTNGQATGYPESTDDTRHVTLKRSKSHEGLGFSIRGGAEHGVGIYVSLVEPGSSAEREGLRVGDQIVRVNDVIFDRVTHADAVKVSQSVTHVTHITSDTQTYTNVTGHTFEPDTRNT